MTPTASNPPPASAPAPTCAWVNWQAPQGSERLCGRPATHREVMSNLPYCAEHADEVAEMFGYEHLDAIAPNVKAEP